MIIKLLKQEKQVCLLEALKPAQALMLDSTYASIAILVGGAYADNAVVAGMHSPNRIPEAFVN